MAKKEYGTRKKYHFIYKTTNLLSGKYYIGMHSTDDLNDGYLGSGTLLRRSLNKYGKENHSIEILEFLNSREELVAREKDIVSLQEIAKKECMNLKVGGEGGNVGKYGKHLGGDNFEKHRNLLKTNNEYLEKFKAKCKESIRRRIEEGTHRTWKDNYDWKGKKHKSVTIEKMKEVKKDHGKGKTNSQYGTCWITNEKENRKIPQSSTIPEGWRLGRKLK